MPPRQKITNFDIQLLAVFYEAWRKNAYPPTIRDLMAKTKITSTSYISSSLIKLSNFKMIEAHKTSRGYVFYPIGVREAIQAQLGVKDELDSGKK